MVRDGTRDEASATRKVFTKSLGTNFIVIERARILICSIDKNANTLHSHIAAAAMGVRRDSSSRAPPAACEGERLDTTYMRVRYAPNATRLKEIFLDPGWRRAVVVRDPVDRFVSAYKSKCARCCYIPGRGTPRGDGCYNCHGALGLRRDRNWSLAEVAQRLADRPALGFGNPHWLHQGQFCGGLEENWQLYTHRIPFERVGEGLAAVFQGREHLLAEPRLVTALCNGSVLAGAPSRRTHTRTASQALTNRTASLLRAHYGRDYALIDRMLRQVEKPCSTHTHGLRRGDAWFTS